MTDLKERIALELGNIDREMWGLPRLDKIGGPHWENSIVKAARILKWMPDEIERLEARIAELEAEPTDAQVEAAETAYWNVIENIDAHDHTKAMRAALQAARGGK